MISQEIQTKNSKQNKKKALPEDLEKLLKTELVKDVEEPQTEERVDSFDDIQDDENKKPTTDKLCIFCQGLADSGRFYNRLIVPLCRNDYETKTLGQVAQQLRELNAGTAN